MILPLERIGRGHSRETAEFFLVRIRIADSALLVFDPNGKFTGKMSGAPADVDGFERFLTSWLVVRLRLRAQEAMVAGNSSFPQQTDQSFVVWYC